MNLRGDLGFVTEFGSVDGFGFAGGRVRIRGEWCCEEEDRISGLTGLDCLYELKGNVLKERLSVLDDSI